MHDFVLALVAQHSPVGRTQENLAHTVEWVRSAHAQGADLVVLPELGITGHAGHPEMVRDAEPVPGGPAEQALASLARELGVHICAGICEVDRGIYYNTQFLVGPEGYQGKQRKVHLSGDEYFHFRHGTGLPVFDLPFARVGIIICYDSLFPEIARCLAVDGAELLLAPHAARFGPWPEDPHDRMQVVGRTKERWRLTQRSRAYDNGCYVGICNAAGRSAPEIEGVEANHAGGCMAIDPHGEVIAESRSTDVEEEMVLATLRGKSVTDRRTSVCFNLQVRRPEVYQALCRPTT